MCEAMIPLPQLVLPKENALGVIKEASIVAGLLFARRGESEIYCRSAARIKNQAESRILIAGEEDIRMFPVLTQTLNDMLKDGLLLLKASEFRINKFEGDILWLAKRGARRVVEEWYPKTVTEADRLAIMQRAC